MPTYEYECTKCGHHFEKLQQMTDKPLRKCPECGGKLKRLIGAGAGIIVKGSGSRAPGYSSLSGATGCGASSPCCGMETPCDTPPCSN